MKLTHLPITLLLLAPCAFAQDHAGAAAMPNPKSQAHDLLAPFVGTWNLNVKIMEGGQTMEMPGTETFELVCNGLWLKSVVDSSFMGQPFQGLSLLGYNPKTKTYEQIWADSMTPGVTTCSLTFDQKARTWNSKLVSGHGPERSAMVWKDDNTIVETGYAKGEDGKEIVAMEITRKRADKAAPNAQPAAAKKADAPGQADAAGKKELDEFLGKWDIVMRMPTPDGKTSEDKGTEICTPVCGGNRIWSDFRCSFMGGQFEGHGLAGYDPVSKKVTNYWVDSMSPYVTVLTGSYDPKTKAIKSSGKSLDAHGEEGTMTESVTWKDDNTRVSDMSVTGKEGTMTFQIVSTRAK